MLFTIYDANGIPIVSPLKQYSFLKRIYILNGTTSYTPSSGVRALDVECTGAGGQGACCSACDSSHVAFTAGGGGGTYSKSFITNIPASPIAVAVGAGGSSAVAGTNNGSAGGNTTFNSTTVVANGGVGGLTTAIQSNTLPGPANTGPGAVAGTGDITTTGTAGRNPYFSGVGTGISGGGGNGTGPYGGAGGFDNVNAPGSGNAGQLYGGGGSGALNLASNASGHAGAPGANGILVITEYV